MPAVVSGMQPVRPLRVLIGCETSGMVRDAFLRRGHDAWSCDLLPSDTPSNRHIKGDVRDVILEGWELAVICHPPCTRLALSGVRWLHKPAKNPIAGCTPEEREAWPGLSEDERLAITWRHLEEGAALFSDLWNAPVPRIAVENPVMHGHAASRIRNFEKAAQTVQPWMFGDPVFKATSLYLRNLPPLEPTNRLTPPAKGTDEYKAWSRIHRMPPGPNRWKERSKTFPGIAEAIADQWGGWAIDQEMAA